MAEEIDRASDRQATWVALRTLRQRPTLVGQTDEGAAVYQVRSVRLLLAPGAAHFRRLVTCAKCGRDVPGSPILAPGDLERPANSVFCDRCVRSPLPPRQEVPRESADPPVLVPTPAAPPGVTDENVGDLQRLSEQIADLLGGQNADLAKLSASVAGVRAEMRELAESNQALARQQQELDQRIAGLAADVAAHPGAMVDTTAEQLQAAVDQLRSQIASLHQRMDDEAASRSDVGALAESTRALAQRDAEIETTLARELADLRSSLAPTVDAAAQPLHAALDRLRSEIASLQQRTDGDAAVRSEVGALAESTRALALARDDLSRKVQELAAQVQTPRDAEIETSLAAELVDIKASLAPMVDATTDPLHAALDQLRSQIAALQQRIDDEATARSEVGALVELNRSDLGELAGQLAPLTGDEAVRLADLSARLGAEDTQLRVEFADGLQLLRAEIASVEQRSRDEFAEVTTLLEGLRKELTDAVHDVAHETLMAVAEPLRDLTKAREEFERRLESIQQKAEEDRRRVEALNASAGAGASRLHALEQKLQTSIQRLIHQAGANSEAERRPSGALLDSLDRQLREAEERLGQL